MSGESKTLTLTPEEILLAARDKDFMLVPTRTVETRELRWSLHKVTVVGSRREIDYLAGFDTLSQAGAWLLGVPVVARDEAAEAKPIGWDDVADEDVMAALVKAQTEANVLKRAVREWVAADAAYSEWMVLPVREDWTSGEAKARKERLEVAEAELRRLAGGKEQR